MKRVTSTLGFVVVSIAVLTAQAPGVKPLTLEGFLLAQKATDIKDTFNAPTILGMMARARTDPRILQVVDKAPYNFIIVSPYTRAATIAVEAKRKFTEATYPTLDLLNSDLVQVVVSPGSSMLTVDAIENMVIRRGDAVIRPSKSKIDPTTVRNGIGVTKASAEGVFTFDYAVFEPSSPITLVLIGKAGNFEWLMTPDELRQLK